MRRASIVLFVLSLAGAAEAQTARIPVQLSHQGDDRVGRGIVVRLRDELARSGSLSYAPTMTPEGYVVRMLTIGIADQPQSAYSVAVLRIGGLLGVEFLSSNIGYCGESMTAACASDIYEYAAREITADKVQRDESLRRFRETQGKKPGT